MTIRSEQTSNMTDVELKSLQEKVKNMNLEELKKWQNSQNPDKMGFSGREAI